MIKKFNIFIFSIGVLLIIFTIFLDFFTSFHLPFIRKYISFIYYSTVLIYWLNDKKFNLKYFFYYLIISIYFNFLLGNTIFHILFNAFFSNHFIICEKFFTIVVVGFSASLLNSFLYNYFKKKSSIF
ncbi:hypothetical protein FV113G1_15840 [Fusobacterium varium]|nr:hypothetical protein FV113G1_15840 [Fusobacterium varium]